MQSWFVYYKVDPATAGGLEPRLRRMQQDAVADNGARARLLRRADAAAGAPTTMLEVYDAIAEPARFARALEAALARAEFPPALLAQRRTEVFEEA